MKTKKTDITMRIPGGWYGNDPGSFPRANEGNVTIDASKTWDALRWLSKRAHILGTWVSETPNPGLCISYEIKD